jgi:four helix bundle protein
MEIYKFQSLEVYQMALAYTKSIYSLSIKLPDRERFNLISQIERAATSVVLNIAEGSTGQSNPEQKRFLGLAIRSYLETIACLDLIEQFEYLPTSETESIRDQGHQLFIKLNAFRKALK